MIEREKYSPRVDAYIDDAAPYAQPILRRIREIFHASAPEISEDIKWGMPAFMHKGIVGNMAAFKQHVSLGFWKGKLMNDELGLFEDQGRTQITAMKLRAVDDLPAPAILSDYIRQAVQLNESGAKLPGAASRSRQPGLTIPDFLVSALAGNPAARETFEGFSYTHQKEYVEWLTGAKREETREKRLAAAIEWMSEGKPRNWKYTKR